MIRRRRLTMALGVLALGAAVQSGRSPVIICHRAADNPPITITVDAAAVAAHLGHGDSLDACPSSPSR